MKKFIFLTTLLLLAICGCVSGGKVVTADTFSQVTTGMTYKEVTDKLGQPYSKKNLGNGEVEYLYIEKMNVGNVKPIEEKHYLIIFKNGRVTRTKTKYLNRPSYEGNSYEMQTSYNDDN